MNRLCSACEDRSVYVVSVRRYGAKRCVENHDLCDRCYRSLRSQIVAARQEPKPQWAYRSTLKVMAHEDQAPRRMNDLEVYAS